MAALETLQRLRATRQRADEAHADILRLLRQGRAEGCTVIELAAAASLSRVHVHRLLQQRVRDEG